MKTNNTRLNFSLLTTALTGLALLSLTGGSALAANWTITDLGALGATGNVAYESRANNINHAGQVAGRGVVLTNGVLQMHYVVWSNGTQIDLGVRIDSSNVDAAPINDAGQVAGVIEAEDSQPFLWQAGVVTRLSRLAGTTGGHVTGINASGTVVGYLGTNPWKSVRWQGITVTDLGLAYGIASAINDSGDIAIKIHNYYVKRGAVLSGNSTNVVNVTGLDPNYGITEALDLNNAGQVCGRFTVKYTVSPNHHAFLWQGGVGTPLPEFPSGVISQSEAVALNNHGHAVGWATRGASDNPAVLWRDGTRISLSDLPEVVAAGWSALTARDINDHGQIVGYGFHGGLVRAFLLSPVTAPPPTHTIAISWPAPAEGWVLEGPNALPSVAVASWPQVQLPYQTNGDSISVTFTNTPPIGNQFFRLHKP